MSIYDGEVVMVDNKVEIGHEFSFPSGLEVPAGSIETR
jgi:hypothetical protein